TLYPRRSLPLDFLCGLSDEFVHDAAMHIGQPEVTPGRAEGELLVVEAEQRQDGGMEVVDVDFVFDRLKAVFVGGPMNITAAHTASGHPHGETVVVMIAPVDLARV